MRWPSKLLATVCCGLGFATAEEWRVKSASCEMSAKSGCGKLGGPVTLTSDRWTLSSSREAIVSARAKVVRSITSGGERDYKLATHPARILFLGKCAVRNQAGRVVIEAPFLVYQVDTGTVTCSGPGITRVSDDGVRLRVDPASGLSLDLETGEIGIPAPPVPE